MKQRSYIIILYILAAICFCACAPAAAAQEPSPAPTLTPVESPAPKEDSIFDLMDGGSLSYQVDMAEYYLQDMVAAAQVGDRDAGHKAEASRNAAIDAIGSSDEKISFDDLYLLARLISLEAGSDWLTDEFRMCVGEVVMNRVASPEFPDTLHDVIYQKGQYSGVETLSFEHLKPGDKCVNCALRLLRGERLMAPSVVFQSSWIQGEIFSMYSDWRLGNTYFCVSRNLDLYPN